MRYFIIILSTILFSCKYKEPKSKIVINHIIKSKTEGRRWNPTIQMWEKEFLYHYSDGDSLKSSKVFNVDDTVPYIYYKY